MNMNLRLEIYVTETWSYTNRRTSGQSLYPRRRHLRNHSIVWCMLYSQCILPKH